LSAPRLPFRQSGLSHNTVRNDHTVGSKGE